MREYDVYYLLKEISINGIESRPRNQRILELPYFQGVIKSPWSNYKERKYPINYFKQELQWYLHANPYDQRICEHATMWNKLIQEDGRILSNYGYYWFNPEYMNGMSGFDWVLSILKSDPHSRQAYIPMNNFTHCFKGNADFVCTKGIQFRIINNKLLCHVAMRSSDAIFGLATDLPCFWALWNMLAVELDISKGDMIFSADSVHIYEHHFEMVSRILRAGPTDTVFYAIPEITDAQDLIQEKFQSPFGKWLTEAKL